MFGGNNMKEQTVYRGIIKTTKLQGRYNTQNQLVSLLLLDTV